MFLLIGDSPNILRGEPVLEWEDLFSRTQKIHATHYNKVTAELPQPCHKFRFFSWWDSRKLYFQFLINTQLKTFFTVYLYCLKVILEANLLKF